MQRLVIALLVLITAGMILFFGSMIFLSAPVPEAPRETAAPLPRASAQAPVIAPSGLAIPVAGVRAIQLSDTYAQARAGGARVHDAIDIMAPRGTPVVAAADGTVEKLFFSRGGGGITAYVRSADRQWSYYYAHLDAYAAGLAEGQRIRRGDPVGTVGSTGNADPADPHLHFAVNRMGPADRWWQGTPINPYPLLAGGGAPR
jgi:murein DD-endopeptidase MepM/ murein hydrolase activator NlpD